MKQFKSIVLDFIVLENDLDDFGSLLQNHLEIEENILTTFFQKRPHLLTFIGTYFIEIRSLNIYAFEFPLFGSFRTDFVIGDDKSHSYLFVEFESGRSDSILKTNGRNAKDWSKYFEHGYSQIVDWFWKLDEEYRQLGMLEHFDTEAINYSGILIIGRDEGLNQLDKRRLEWRQDKVIINSKKIFCVTYDQLYRDLSGRLENIKGIEINKF